MERIKNRPTRTFNGFQIYYDQATGEAVGIVYKKFVFLKKTLLTRMTYSNAELYCKTLVINGIESRLCQIDMEKFRDEYLYIGEFRLSWARF